MQYSAASSFIFETYTNIRLRVGHDPCQEQAKYQVTYTFMVEQGCLPMKQDKIWTNKVMLRLVSANHKRKPVSIYTSCLTQCSPYESNCAMTAYISQGASQLCWRCIYKPDNPMCCTAVLEALLGWCARPSHRCCGQSCETANESRMKDTT